MMITELKAPTPAAYVWPGLTGAPIESDRWGMTVHPEHDIYDEVALDHFHEWFRSQITKVTAYCMRKAFRDAVSAYAHACQLVGEDVPEGYDPSRLGFLPRGLATIDVDAHVEAGMADACALLRALHCHHHPDHEDWIAPGVNDPIGDLSGEPWEVL